MYIWIQYCRGLALLISQRYNPFAKNLEPVLASKTQWQNTKQKLKKYNVYKIFRACFIIVSTLASGWVATILSITRSACFLAKPSTSKADNASSLLVLS